MARELFFFELGGAHVAVVKRTLPEVEQHELTDGEVQEIRRELRKGGFRHQYVIVSEAEMERSGLILKSRANVYADYSY